MHYTLRKKCPCSELLWSAFSHIRTEYGDLHIHSIRMRENVNKNNSEYEHFLRIDKVPNSRRVRNSKERGCNLIVGIIVGIIPHRIIQGKWIKYF